MKFQFTNLNHVPYLLKFVTSVKLINHPRLEERIVRLDGYEIGL